MTVKGIIFDVDGVIFNSEKAHVIAWKKVFGRRNIKLAKKDYIDGEGIADLEFLVNLRKEGKIPAKYDLKTIIKEKHGEMLKLIGKNIGLFTGMKQVIRKLAKEYTLCVASNSVKKLVIGLLENSGIKKYFKYFVTNEDIKRPKPYPDVYLLAVKKMKLKSAECIAVEDTGIGVEAVKKAGLYCIAVTNTQAKEKLKKADLIVNKLKIDLF
jgi:beta-phosphoglucomutase